MAAVKRIGVLTGGSDAPGLDPAIKGLVYRASDHEETVGLSDGWLALLNPPFDAVPLDRVIVRRWDRDGGTNLGSSRTNPFKTTNEEGERIAHTVNGSLHLLAYVPLGRTAPDNNKFLALNQYCANQRRSR